MTNLPAATSSASGEPERDAPSAIRLGNLLLDLDAYRARVGARPVDLSYQEFELLRYLAGLPNRVASFSALSRFLWASEGQRENRRLHVLVCRLRQKLAGLTPYRLETVRGRGYGLLGSGPAPLPDQGGGGAS